MNINNLDIHSILNGESLEFKVKSSSPMPLKQSMFTFSFGIGMTAITIFVFVKSGCIGPDFFDCIASENLFLYFIATLLFVAGLAGLIIGLKNILSEGPLIIGTPNRLILVKENSIESILWDQFLGDIALSGNDRIGTITLKKRTGRFNNNDDNSKTFVPDLIYMVKIERPKEVEAFCRKRIFNL